ncbi:MAG: DUF1987 domain-containing protein [Bacteroidota bacterium]
MAISDMQERTSVVEGTNSQDIFFLKGTSETPEVLLDRKNGVMKFSGRSLPENAKSVYNDIKDWVHWYSQDPLQGTHVIFSFDYFNTASSKMIMEVLDTIKIIEQKDNSLTIDWHYQEDDEDMFEAGEDFAEISELKFNFYSYE